MNVSNSYLKEIMKRQVNTLKDLGFIDNNFVSLDTTAWKNLTNERAYVSNFKSISNLNTTGHICLLAVTVATVTANCIEKFKFLMGLTRTA